MGDSDKEEFFDCDEISEIQFFLSAFKGKWIKNLKMKLKFTDTKEQTGQMGNDNNKLLGNGKFSDFSNGQKSMWGGR